MRLRSFGAIPKKRYSEQKLICDLVHSQIEENSIAIIVLPIVKWNTGILVFRQTEFFMVLVPRCPNSPKRMYPS